MTRAETGRTAYADLGPLLSVIGALYAGKGDTQNAVAYYTKALDRGLELGDRAAIEQYVRIHSANPGATADRTPTTPTPAQNSGGSPTSKGACYIATAVYGSYDAPPVKVLRRYRDERLAQSRPGRLLIRFYYLTSPSLARHLTGSALLNRPARRLLDAVVRRLEANQRP
jgi:hypothetical protein